MSHPILVAWTLASLHMLAPYKNPEQWLLTQKANVESKEQYEARLAETAEDLVSTIEDAPPLPGLSRVSSLRLVMAVAYMEGGFQLAVDRGIGRGVGDSGRSFCHMQIMTGTASGHVPTSDPEIGSWTGKDLVTDRQKCFRAGLHLLRRSMMACSKQKQADRLSAYATGSCRDDEEKSRIRVRFASGKILGRPIPKEAPPSPSPTLAAGKVDEAPAEKVVSGGANGLLASP